MFRDTLKANLVSTIRAARKNSTVAMSLDNLRAIVPTPHDSDGPRGTNAQWAYAQMFADVVASLPGNYRSFIR